MARTKTKGDLAEIAVMKEFARRGWRLLIPWGEDQPYDLVMENRGEFKRVQVKHVTMTRGVIRVKCRSTNNWSDRKYTSDEVDWIAAYCPDTDKVYIVPSAEFEGRTEISLRINHSKNNQKSGIHWAKDYEMPA